MRLPSLGKKFSWTLLVAGLIVIVFTTNDARIKLKHLYPKLLD